MSDNKTETKPSTETSPDVLDINRKILEHSDKVKKLNNETDKHEVDEEEKILLKLKSDYKHLTGKEWSFPSNGQSQHQVKNRGTDDVNNLSNKPSPPKDRHNHDDATTLTTKITELDNKIKNLKTGNRSIDINELLKLKSQYKETTGHEWQSTAHKPIDSDGSKQSSKVPKQSSETTVKEMQDHANNKKQSRLGMETKKEDNLVEWYWQVVTKGELIEHYDISGCYIIRPWCFAIWELIKDYLGKEIKKLGVQNCYFPLFIPKSTLEKGKTHIASFAPKVAWVTKSGTSDLAEPVAIRPTSEMVMYPAYSKWIQSFRDLPMKLNQWNNVVRWEFKHPQPFLRNREVLWQEGHTAFAKQNEADDEVYKILDLYASVYTDLLAVPIIKGRKTEKEKFAGSDFTTTVEAFISINGRGIQGAASHFLGQNFSKLFEITYEDPVTQGKKYVFQNSWGITTRTIGIMIMVHSDNKGLVLPPRVATYQIVIVPCGTTAKTLRREKNSLLIACKTVEKRLNSAGIRVYGDYRDNYTAGWKFNYWELKGVPVRLEIGPMDMSSGKVMLIRRDNGGKISVSINDVVYKVQSLLERIHKSMLNKATDELNSQTVLTTDWSEFMSGLSKKCILLSPFCGNIECEDKIRQDSTKRVSDDVKQTASSKGAKSLCIPFHQPRSLKPDENCIRPNCKNKPSAFTFFGKSY